MRATFIDTCIAVNSIKPFSIHCAAEKALEETAAGIEVSWILKSYQEGMITLPETMCKLYEQMAVQLD